LLHPAGQLPAGWLGSFIDQFLSQAGSKTGDLNDGFGASRAWTGA
jgi:hypothetical protein